MRLGSLVGKVVLIDIPTISEQAPQWFTLVDVESSGLWLQSDALSALLPVTRTADGGPGAVFVPFAQIRFVFGTESRTPPTEEELARVRAAAETAQKPAAPDKPAPRSRTRKPSSPSRRSRDA
jgi:hypothetical protein